MKSLLLIFALAFQFVGASALAQGSSQSYNVRVAPLGLLIGYLNVDLDIKVSDTWTVGPTVSYWSFDFDSSSFVNNKIKSTSSSIGVRGTYSPNGVFQNGIYFSPMLQYRTSTAEGVARSTGQTIKGTGSLPVLTGLVGYQYWLSENVNFNAGAGLSLGTSTTKVDVNDGTSTTSVETSRTSGLALDLMLGYSF